MHYQNVLSTKLTHDISNLFELCIKISRRLHPEDWYVSTIESCDTRSKNDIIIVEVACTRPLPTVYTVGTSCRHCELTLSYATPREKLLSPDVYKSTLDTSKPVA